MRGDHAVIPPHHGVFSQYLMNEMPRLVRRHALVNGLVREHAWS